MKVITGIKAISFDGDGTLWDFERVMRHSLGEVLKELERLAPDIARKLDVEKMIEIRNKIDAELKGKVSPSPYYKISFHMSVDTHSIHLKTSLQ